MTHSESARGIRLASLLLPFSLFNLNSNLLLGRRGDLSKSVRSACVLRRRFKCVFVAENRSNLPLSRSEQNYFSDGHRYFSISCRALHCLLALRSFDGVYPERRRRAQDMPLRPNSESESHLTM